jgi:hypothetical protein
MKGALNFVVDLATAGKGSHKIKETVKAAYGVHTLQKTVIYTIIKRLRQGTPPLTFATSIQKKRQDSGSHRFCRCRH